MLRTKCITLPKGKDDGLRISIMSRHTLDDGVTPDPKIHSSCFDIWWRDLAPPPRMIGDYYKRGLSWQEFETRFCEYLRSKTKVLETLIKLARGFNVTILCTEKSPEHCHRRLVAEACRNLVPSLQVVIE